MTHAAEPPQGGFVPEPDAWHYRGALTLDNAAAVMAAADALPLPATGVLDFVGLTRADSVALALIMALYRRAGHEGRALQARNLPAGLASLAMAYGVDDLVAGQRTMPEADGMPGAGGSTAVVPGEADSADMPGAAS